jgi:hypothetical protein
MESEVSIMKNLIIVFSIITFKIFISQSAAAASDVLLSSYQHIIDQNLDISSEDLGQVAERSEAFWTSASSLHDPILQMGKVELATLRDLNLLSSELWKKLLH